MSFRYKENQYNKKYLLRLWMSLYYSNPKSIAYNTSFKKVNQIKKIGWHEKHVFKVSGVTLNEVQIVNDSLVKLPREDLEVLSLLMSTIAINDSPKVLLVDSFKKIGKVSFFAFTVILSTKFFDIKPIELKVNRLFLLVVYVMLLFLFIGIFYYETLKLTASSYKKIRTIEKILPKMINKALEDYR